MIAQNRLYLTTTQHQIEIEKVDIYSVTDVDALVFGTNKQLNFKGSPLDQKLDKATSNQLLKDCSRLSSGITNLGQCFLTSITPSKDQNFAYKFIVHAIKTIWRTGNSGEAKVLEDLVFQSLNLCHEKGTITSIAFPALMAEKDSFPPELCAQIMVRCILNWCNTFPNSKLKRIKIATLSEPCFEAFNVEYLNLTETKNSQNSSQNNYTPTSETTSFSETSFLSSDEDEDAPAHKMRRREKENTKNTPSKPSTEYSKPKKQIKSILKVRSDNAGIHKESQEKKSITEVAAKNIKQIIEKQVSEGQESQMVISNSMNFDPMSMSTDSLNVDNMESTLNQSWK